MRFDGTRLACWHRIWGVTAGQIELHGIGETEARLRRETAAKIAAIAPSVTAAAPGFQLFGNIRDPRSWDRALARAAGEAEIRRMNGHFQALRPGCGEVVVEAHPGIFLPRGSISKALGHEFDQIRCADGYAFRELCVDYPQGWDWGVAGWVQWRHLRLRIDGLRDQAAPHFLHLLSFDPEHRDIALRIHFFEPDAPQKPAPAWAVRAPAELCVVRDWRLPRGVEGRWDAAALCSIPVPEACHRWSALGVWITPLEKQHMYDWVAGRGAPGMLSHLWLSRA